MVHIKKKIFKKEKKMGYTHMNDGMECFQP